jgi:cytochrome c
MRWRGLCLAPGLAMAAAATAAAAAPDVLHGEQVYNRCVACHSLAADRVGPRHCGLIGRRAGTVPGFLYSDAILKSKLTWDEKTLDRFLAKPMEMIPGTAMTYDGVPDSRDRHDLIAYLKHANETAECRKSAR